MARLTDFSDTNIGAGTPSGRLTDFGNSRQYGYAHGDPFGNPNQFTRSTREDEIDRFNQWMRVQPWYQDYMSQQGLLNRGPDQGFSNRQQGDVEGLLRQQGINLPGAFHIDEGGNINQKSRTKRNLMIAAAIGGGALTAGALSGVFAGAGGVAGGAGSVLPSTAAGFTGAGFAPTVASGLGAGLSGAVLPSTAAAFTGAGFAPSITSGLSGAGGSGLAPLASRPGPGGLTPFRTPVQSNLAGPSTLDRARTITRGLSRLSPNQQEQQQPQIPNQIPNQNQNQPQQQIQIPFSLQTPIFNQGLQGFGGFNARPPIR